jgi:hypothetical protein
MGPFETFEAVSQENAAPAVLVAVLACHAGSRKKLVWMFAGFRRKYRNNVFLTK